MTDDELKKMFDAIRRDIASADEKNVAAHVETRRHFDIALETSDHKVLLVAEGVAQTREDLA